MKLSEAILLGSTVVTPKAGGLRFSKENAGCALGMAVIGCGGTFTGRPREFRMEDRRTKNVEEIFGSWLLRMVPRPCACPAFLTLRDLHIKSIVRYFSGSGPALPRQMRVKDVIAHLFDYHVMQKKNWTLAQVVAWVERWEPGEIGQGVFMAHAYRRSDPLPTPRDFDEAAEWQKTRQAFQARINAKRRRGATIPGAYH
jgi:hypothetical protein